MSPNYNKAKVEAQKLLDNLGFSDPPVSPIEIASSLGISVYSLKMPTGYEDVAGFVDVNEDKIVVNKDEPLTRQTFTVAHEIGHYVLHKPEIVKDPSKYQVLLRTSMLKDSSPWEKEANCFAANLLVPEKMLMPLNEYPESILSTLFGVSQQVITFRRKDIQNGR